VLAQRRDARERFDRLRTAMMLEPRGHAGMYGVIPVRATDPQAVTGVLFTHHEGYSTMCGHATIAIGRWLVESGRVPATGPLIRCRIEAPCGALDLACTVADRAVTHVTFESVPAFAHALDLAVAVPGIGRVVTDIAYGGAFYAILPATRLGLDLFATPLPQLVAAAGALTDTIRADHPVAHPSEPDLSFLYGTILTDDAPPGEETWNLCGVFADHQVDRSPTGSGVTARMALDHARGLVGTGQGRVVPRHLGRALHRPGVAAGSGGRRRSRRSRGRAFDSGHGTFVVEADDPLGFGFDLAGSFAAVRGRG